MTPEEKILELTEQVAILTWQLREFAHELGTRWVMLRKTSPSGKTLFSCKCCGRVSIAPDATCPPYEKSGYGVHQVDCEDWPATSPRLK
jgi:hypothetical protein